MKRAAWIAGAVGAAGLAACAAGWAIEPSRLYRAWLWAFLFWTGLGVGCAGVLMIHNLTGGGWGFPVRRVLRAGAATIVLAPLLFLPLLAGLDAIYPWAREPVPEKSAWLNAPFFVARAAAYFAVWILGAWVLSRPSARRVSGPGLLLYAFTLSFAAVDWGMSLEPHWFSSVYGLLFIAGQLLSTFAVLALAAAILRVDAQRLHDLGNFLFMAVLLWAYLSFSQFLIIWSGHLPEEASWYASRSRGGWGLLAALLAALGFALPFLLLLRRDVKRSPRALAAAAVLVLLMRLADTFWWVAPAFYPDGLRVHWVDLAAPAAIGGLWVSTSFFFLNREAAHA